MGGGLAGKLRQGELHRASAERIAQLRVVLAFFAGRGIRRVLLLLLLKRVAERVRRPRLLGKQQRDGAEERQKQA